MSKLDELRNELLNHKDVVTKVIDCMCESVGVEKDIAKVIQLAEQSRLLTHLEAKQMSYKFGLAYPYYRT